MISIKRSPVFVGGALSLVFYGLIHSGFLAGGLVERYFAMHPVEYVIGVMFFIGVASLVLKFLDIAGQTAVFQHGPILPQRSGHRTDITDCGDLLHTVSEHEKQYGVSYHSSRLRRSLESILRHGNGSQLENDLRFFAEEDVVRAEAGYGFVRMILWAVPMLGFLGTVIGIALALGNLSPDAIEKSLPEVMAGLTIAFDTTALAIALDIALFFGQFVTFREETKLLWAVDQMVEAELQGRFETEAATPADNKQILAVRKMLESLTGTFDTMLQEQARVWNDTMTVANDRYTQMAAETAKQLQHVLVAGMKETLSTSNREVANVQLQFLSQTKEQVSQLAQVMRHGIESVHILQQEMAEQAEVLRDVVTATGQVVSLETALNHNLSALSESSHFEEAVHSLAATIHLLSAKQSGSSARAA